MAKTKRKTTPLDRLAPLVTQVQLAELRLVGSQTKFELSENQPPEELHQRINVKCFRAVRNEVDHIACILTLIIADELVTELHAPPTAKLILEASFALVYAFESLDGITDEQIQEFGQRNALYNAWPYWREFVQSMTTRMGLSALKVPLMRPGGLEFKRQNQPSPLDVKKGARGESKAKKPKA